MAQGFTAIQVREETRQKLANMKNCPMESMDDVVNRMISNFEDDDLLTDEEIVQINRSIEDKKSGRIKSIDQVKKNMGI